MSSEGPNTTRDPEEIMREIWARFLASNPGSDFKSWDETPELERVIFREQVIAAGNAR